MQMDFADCDSCTNRNESKSTDDRSTRRSSAWHVEPTEGRCMLASATTKRSYTTQENQKEMFVNSRIVQHASHMFLGKTYCKDTYIFALRQRILSAPASSNSLLKPLSPVDLHIHYITQRLLYYLSIPECIPGRLVTRHLPSSTIPR